LVGLVGPPPRGGGAPPDPGRVGECAFKGEKVIIDPSVLRHVAQKGVIGVSREVPHSIHDSTQNEGHLEEEGGEGAF